MEMSEAVIRWSQEAMEYRGRCERAAALLRELMRRGTEKDGINEVIRILEPESGLMEGF